MSYHMQRSCGHEWQARIDHSCVPAKSCLWVTLWQRQLGNSSVDVQRSVQCDVSCRHVLAVMFLQFPQSCLGQSLESHSSQNPKQMQQNKQPIVSVRVCVCVLVRRPCWRSPFYCCTTPRRKSVRVCRMFGSTSQLVPSGLRI